MKEFLKVWTIINTVWQIVNSFIAEGVPSINPASVATETTKELTKKVSAGYLPADVLAGHEDIVQQALEYHPAIQNVKPEQSSSSALDE